MIDKDKTNYFMLIYGQHNPKLIQEVEIILKT